MLCLTNSIILIIKSHYNLNINCNSAYSRIQELADNLEIEKLREKVTIFGGSIQYLICMFS